MCDQLLRSGGSTFGHGNGSIFVTLAHLPSTKSVAQRTQRLITHDNLQSKYLQSQLHIPEQLLQSQAEYLESRSVERLQSTLFQSSILALSSRRDIHIPILLNSSQ